MTRRSGRYPHTELRIRPEPGTRYVLVRVWPTKRALDAHRRREKHHPLGGEASCTETLWWRVDDRGRRVRHRRVAEVNFYRAQMGSEVVSHEMFHATMAWGRRVRIDWTRLGDDDSVNAVEERLAYVHSTLCSEFIRVAYAKGWYDEDDATSPRKKSSKRKRK